MSHPVAAEELFQIVASKESSDLKKLELISNLKTHIKKDVVNLDEVPKYIEALSIAVDIPDLGISASSFSALSHLIKRVSMQDKSGTVLKSQSFLVLPIIINRLGDSKTSTLSSARKALEAYWFSSPKEVEDAILEIALKHRNTKIIVESVNWLHHIVNNINQHFKLDRFVPQLISLLSAQPHSNHSEVQTSIETLLSDYYNLKHNKLYKFDLARELELKNVPATVRDTIMNSISGLHPDNAPVNSKESNFVVAGTSHAENVEIVETPHPLHGSIPEDVKEIVSKFNYEIDASIPKINFDSPDKLNTAFEDLLAPFNGKETEFNWALREKNTLKMRSIIRGNAASAYREELLACLKEASDGICKSVSSLRTTLSTHGCQLVKECAIILQSDVDTLIDMFFPTLIRLCSATKHIASTNANMAVIAIYVNASFNYRNMQRIVTAASEKNVSPRSYSGLWLQIMVLRFSNTSAFFSSHGAAAGTCVDASMKVLTKLLKDPNPTVRQVAKDSYWTLWRKLPSQTELLLSKMEPNIVKIIERSKPKYASDSHPQPIAIAKVRPSLKESIMEKNKELRNKQREFSRDSRPSSRSSSDSVIRIPAMSRPTEPSIRSAVPRRTLSNSSAYLSKHEPISTISAQSDNIRSQSSDAIQPDISVNKEILEVPSHITHIPPTVESKEVVFDKKTDPILKFLSSNQTDLITEGINLLKYAIMGEEDLSVDINGLLRKISLRQPNLLSPIIVSNDHLFKRSIQFFSTEDFLRVCSILLNPIERRNIELIISLLEVDDLYEAVVQLLSYTISTSNILGDDELTMQIIRYKSTILQSVVDILRLSLEKIPIRDSYFSKLTSNLLELVSILKSTEIYPSFSKLLTSLYSINATLFFSELEIVDKSTREEVEFIVGIDHTLSLKVQTTIPNSVFELTEVQHESGYDKFSPVKAPNDFTMIWPIKKDNSEYTFLPEKELGLEEVHSSERPPPIKAATLAKDLAQVKLTENFSVEERRDPLKAYIEKSDPLRSISNRNKPITIYEDSRGSPQKVKEYRYSDWNWYNFQIAKLNSNENAELVTSCSIGNFKALCDEIKSASIADRTLASILSTLKNIEGQGLEFAEFYEDSGRFLIEQSLWSYYRDCDVLSHSAKLRGLIIVKQLLINHTRLNLLILWKTMLRLSDSSEPDVEMKHALSDVVDEVLSGIYGTDELLGVFLNNTDVGSGKGLGCSKFILDTLSKSLESSSVPLMINEELIIHLHEVLQNFTSYGDPQIRRAIIQCYGKLLKATRISNSVGNMTDNSTDKNVMEGILSRFTVTQKKLVEYYSQE
ncbi:putative mitotic spindle protein [Scheffersomyces xylosifermentans]|uniref:putative mitotic spindle protein n=1 Tax=Scheffersomyces xylosifermentans TaxID=1304137 RepID=UPI00315D4E33